MRNIIKASVIALLSTLIAPADDFQPNPAWVTDSEGKSGYFAYDSFQLLDPAEVQGADFDFKDTVRFSNYTWRGIAKQFLEGRVKGQAVSGSNSDSAALFRNNGKWIEIGRASLTNTNTNSRQVFLLYEWDNQNGGNRKSSFYVKEDFGVLKIDEVMEIGNGLALMKLGVGIHDWVKLIIVDLNDGKPKGVIDLSKLEILSFTQGQELKVRYKDPVTRAQMLIDPDAIEKLQWTAIDILTNGVINPDLLDESLFEVTVPAAP